MKLGRPTTYGIEARKEARAYLKDCVEKDETPWIEELALRLGKSDRTLKRWADKYKKFRAIYYKILTFQKYQLKVKSLDKGKGGYVSKVATLLLTADHDIIPTYKREVSGAGGKPIEVEAKLSPEQEKAIAGGIAEIVKEQLK